MGRYKENEYYLAKKAAGLIRGGKENKKKHRHRKYCATCWLRVSRRGGNILCPICKNPTVAFSELPQVKGRKRPKWAPFLRPRQKGKKSEPEPVSRRRAYDVYITKSPAWQALRRQVLERDGGLCQRCKEPGNHVHHLTYRRLLHEALDDLLLLCESCHKKEHPGWEPRGSNNL